MDAAFLESQEEEIPNSILSEYFPPSAMGVKKQVEHENNCDLMMTVSRLLYRWILSNPSGRELSHDHASRLVDFGVTSLPPTVARTPYKFTRDVAESVALTEPCGALSLMALLGSAGADPLKASMREAVFDVEEIADEKDIFKRGIILVLMEKLGKEAGCTLDDILQFHDGAPPWTKECYRLISFVRNSDSGAQIPVRVTWKSGASPHLGFKAREPDDVMCWIKDPNGVPFIFPDAHHWSDALAIVENLTTLERSMLVIQDRTEATDVKEPLSTSCYMEDNWLSPLLDAENTMLGEVQPGKCQNVTTHHPKRDTDAGTFDY
ncbi:uncharacterized protein EV420DRAFT_1053591 [Desarmillaria tabescens]|uniref:Uncharacterized protein n=1 Tax=Armillaria tabescens TaxID=1929756 RepID=A0AA39NFD7_ARMTA|nr:uncharacterized protein EV420DRAFT_1053591 [Desarmillaria tabescens]KAK0464613.1 hypothetical protein EV420DRAFT_1053591 [Desarmillaria tabescens]